jgi:hypothetical protein
MSKSNFRKSDAKRLISAAECAGLKIGRVEVDKNGKIAIFPSDDAASGNAVNEWDTESAT